MKNDDSIPVRLRALRVRSGLSMARLATALQLAGPSSYQRYETDDIFKKDSLPLHIIRGLLDVLVGKGKPAISREEVLMLGGMQELTVPQLASLDEHSWIWCIGEVAGGIWREAFEWPRDDWLPVAMAIPDGRYSGVQRRAVRVIGDSMDLVYPDGSLVLFVRFADIGGSPKRGDRVIVGRHRQGLTEATVKEYAIDAKGRPWLSPRSSNPAHAAIPLERAEDGETIDVFGLVVSSQRLE
jgi:transcriptional regulator with XRE-family HTH domain